MTPLTQPRITVGVFDAEESDHAVRWGARHAHQVGGTLHLVHAFVWTELDVNTDPIPGLTGSGIRTAANGLMKDAAAIARAEHEDLEITSQIIDGNAVPVLVEVSEESDVIVVGGRGLGRLLTLIVGSKSLALAARSHCPVVVVRGAVDADGPIGLVHHETALEHVQRAGDLAAAYGRRISVVVRATTTPEQAEEILADIRGRLGTTHPQVYVEGVRIAAGGSARELVRASQDASIMVVAGERSAPDAPVHSPRQLVTVLRYANTPVWIERE
ncbi:universal stress protein [Brachybacterium sp. DNPG3]